MLKKEPTHGSVTLHPGLGQIYHRKVYANLAWRDITVLDHLRGQVCDYAEQARCCAERRSSVMSTSGHGYGCGQSCPRTWRQVGGRAQFQGIRLMTAGTVTNMIMPAKKSITS
jgi:hypothetical protein